MIKIKQFFCLTHRKKRYQMLLRVSVAMSKRGQNCPVSSSRKQVNLRWWKDDSRWKPEQKRARLTVSTTKLQVMWVDSVGTSRGSSHLEEVSWLSVVPTMEDKNPWNGYGKPSFHILNLSNVQIPRLVHPSPLQTMLGWRNTFRTG